ncbi:hypothetical protein ES703_100850 [subsurface metagenome]
MKDCLAYAISHKTKGEIEKFHYLPHFLRLLKTRQRLDSLASLFKAWVVKEKIMAFYLTVRTFNFGAPYQ